MTVNQWFIMVMLMMTLDDLIHQRLTTTHQPTNPPTTNQLGQQQTNPPTHQPSNQPRNPPPGGSCTLPGLLLGPREGRLCPPHLTTVSESKSDLNILHLNRDLSLLMCNEGKDMIDYCSNRDIMECPKVINGFPAVPLI